MLSLFRLAKLIACTGDVGFQMLISNVNESLGTFCDLVDIDEIKYVIFCRGSGCRITSDEPLCSDRSLG